MEWIVYHLLRSHLSLGLLISPLADPATDVLQVITPANSPHQCPGYQRMLNHQWHHRCPRRDTSWWRLFCPDAEALKLPVHDWHLQNWIQSIPPEEIVKTFFAPQPQALDCYRPANVKYGGKFVLWSQNKSPVVFFFLNRTGQCSLFTKESFPLNLLGE